MLSTSIPFWWWKLLLQDLAEALSRLSLLPVDWQGRAKLVSWLDTLSTMQVTSKIRSIGPPVERKDLKASALKTMHRWLSTSTVQASDELDESQARQLSFDLESAYNDFNKILHSSWEAHNLLAITCIIVSSLNSAILSLLKFLARVPGRLIKCGDLPRGLYKQYTNIGSLELRLLHYIYYPSCDLWYQIKSFSTSFLQPILV